MQQRASRDSWAIKRPCAKLSGNACAHLRHLFEKAVAIRFSPRDCQVRILDGGFVNLETLVYGVCALLEEVCYLIPPVLCADIARLRLCVEPEKFSLDIDALLMHSTTKITQDARHHPPARFSNARLFRNSMIATPKDKLSNSS